MSVTISEPSRRRASGFLSHGFRPFFLLAALWAIACLILWIVAFATGFGLPSRFDPLTWHIHEMLFGFIMAAIAGFLLTAIPNWTGRLPVRDGPLVALVGCWVAGRIACLFSGALPVPLVLLADLVFPVVLIAVATREIVAGRNWRNLIVIGPVTILGVANLLMHLEAMGHVWSVGLGWRLGIAAVIVLISVVGGRIIPSFTRNWLAKRRSTGLPGVFGWVDRVALGVLLLGLLCWALHPDFWPVGLLLLVAATLHLWRLARWRGEATGAEPLLLVLHVAYAWLVLGITLLGLAVLEANGIATGVPQSAAVHALSTGAIATMILAVMTRATRGHTGRDLVADWTTILIFILVTLAAITRVIAVLAGEWMLPLLVVSAALWIGAFGFFVFTYGPMLVLPRKDA